MSTDQQWIVEDFKAKGNALFQKSNLLEALQAYTSGIKAWKDGMDPTLKATLHSNRAAVRLKGIDVGVQSEQMAEQLEACIEEDCTVALDKYSANLSESLRSKLLFRRAKARFLLTEGLYGRSDPALLNEAAKDLLQCLSLDKSNKAAAQVLQAVRAKHALQKGTPVSQTLKSLQDAEEAEQQQHYCKVLIGLLNNDGTAAMEVGRRGGLVTLLQLEAWQVVACACQHGPFVREFGADISQQSLLDYIKDHEDESSKSMSCLTVWLRLILYLDDVSSLEEESGFEDDLLIQTLNVSMPRQPLLQASLDLLSSWTAVDRIGLVSAASEKMAPTPKTEAELRAMKPREVALYKKRQYELQERDRALAKKRSLLFCSQGGLAVLMDVAVGCPNHALQQQIGIVLGRLLASIQEEDEIKRVCHEFFRGTTNVANDDHLTIEEIREGDEDLEDPAAKQTVDAMKRVFFSTSLLLGKPEFGATTAIPTIKADVKMLLRTAEEKEDEEDEMPSPGLAIVSELVSSAASVEQCRAYVSSLLTSGSIDTLLRHAESKSGAASAVAKLGLADKALTNKEGEVMGMLQIAAELLQDVDRISDGVDTKGLLPIAGMDSSTATTTTERAIELIAYLCSKTLVKEEIAHGFKSSQIDDKTILERMVDFGNSLEDASTSAYALASSFQLMSVSTETLRKEAFEGKDITMEQYDQLQALGKTEEEKELQPVEVKDPTDAVNERIGKLAAAQVPKLMVKLATTNDPSEATLEQLTLGWNRMAVHIAARGLLIQQGVLSACIKIEKTDATSSDTGKNVARLARHCIAKLLVTTNPTLLTNSQRMGSIKPLMELIRDHTASDLQHYEALLAITNLATIDDETRERILAQKGVSTLNYAMFSSHELVRCAATEAMCNLVGHSKHVQDTYMTEPENLRLWLAFAADIEENLKCARAAVGGLAMSVAENEKVREALVGMSSFKETIFGLLESGNLELIHRTLYLIRSLVGSSNREVRGAVEAAGIVVFCRAYVENYHSDGSGEALNMTKEEQGLLQVTVELAMSVVQCSTS